MMRISCVQFLILAVMAAMPARPAGADYKQAVLLYNQGKYDKAIQELKPDLDRNPDWEPGHRLLGLCYLNLNNNALAVSSFSRAVQLKSGAYSTYLGLGQAYFYMQKYDSCIAALNQGEPFAAKDKEPEKARAKICKFRGAAYYRIGKFKEAEEDLTNALRMNQSDWGDFFMVGDAYYQLGRVDEAIQALEKAISLKPGESTATNALGKAYVKKGIALLTGKQYEAAAQAFLKAKDYHPKNGLIYYNLGEVYLFQKKYPDAEKALSLAADLMPKSIDVYGRMGLVYEKQRKWDLALGAYKKAAEINPAKWVTDAIARVNENKKSRQ